MANKTIHFILIFDFLLDKTLSVHFTQGNINLVCENKVLRDASLGFGGIKSRDYAQRNNIDRTDGCR